MPSRATVLQTQRVLLRPTEVGDAERAFEIQANWNVTRNLRMAAFPPDRADMAAWFASHETEWAAGTAFRFAILTGDRIIGVIDLDEIDDGIGDLGYWLEEAAWGQGFAFEAATAVVRFGFEAAGLTALRSGHAVDNPASGRVLTKLGFRHTENVPMRSLARGTYIQQRRYALDRLS